MTNGERLKFLREKKGLTQKDVATKLGLEPAAISKYELDMREPNIEALKKLASIFNVSIDYLLGRTSDVYASDADRDVLDLSLIKDKYNLFSRKVNKIKDIYTNDTTVQGVVNELCCGVGKTTYGESKINTNISFVNILEILDDLQNSKMPSPQIMLKIRDLENSIIIIEIDSYDDEEMPLVAIDRIAVYTTKLSQEYNVLGLAVSIDKNEKFKLIDGIYQKNNETYYTQLHLPQTLLTANEYIDIMSRL